MTPDEIRPQTAAQDAAFVRSYLDTLNLVERLHRLLLDVIKDEFERLGVLDVTPVQALLLFQRRMVQTGTSLLMGLWWLGGADQR